MNNNFLFQFVARLLKTNPKFFKTLQKIVLFLTIVSGCIGVIQQNVTELPAWISWIGGKVIWISGIVAWIIARLPNEDPNEKK